ncbi:MAG: ribonuclease III [Synergistaceae bacterium]|jgi:ribonuclease-3|nr:ribonuclease III [Synergistaceae bacterium]
MGFDSINFDTTNDESLNEFQKKLGYFFRDRGLLETALCHASYAHENGLTESNERLEFLGDSVLGMVVSHVLYEARPDATEGELSNYRVEFVCRDALVRWAENLELPRVLMKGKSLKTHTPPSLFADAMEAVLGAVYLDGGYDAAVRATRRYLFGSGTALLDGRDLDAKSRLQVLMQAKDMGLPQYETLSVTGPSHSPLFSVRVRVGGKTWNGTGASRKAAELTAAAAALENGAALEDEKTGNSGAWNRNSRETER